MITLPIIQNIHYNINQLTLLKGTWILFINKMVTIPRVENIYYYMFSLAIRPRNSYVCKCLTCLAFFSLKRIPFFTHV